MNTTQKNTLLGAKLITESSQSATDKCFWQKGMDQCISVVGEHEYLLKLITSTDS
jgi:hypothetical protein